MNTIDNGFYPTSAFSPSKGLGVTWLKSSYCMYN